jgi:mannose-6-phosphate isomerase
MLMIDRRGGSPRRRRRAGRIASFRGLPPPADPYHPEDWLGSTTARFGAEPAGLSSLPDGRLLADAIAADPAAWLGPAHVARYGADPAILVKLLDAGERLPLHVHPDRRFATSHLASGYGKTEAWVIMAAAPDAVVHLGFARDVAPDELARWVAQQRVAEMLAATNRVQVRTGDAVLCPAGLPHAIGEGVFLVEVQEPTDFSVLLEWDGYQIDGAATGHLGLGFDTALACVDRGAWSPARIGDLFRSRAAARGTEPLFPAAADPFFAAERLRPDPVVRLDPAFAVLVVTAGAGVLGAGAELPVRAGDTLLIPYAAGVCELRGTLTAVRCHPPA